MVPSRRRRPAARTLVLAGAVAIAVAVAGCRVGGDGGTRDLDRDDRYEDASVVGVVVDTDGAPVPGAVVEVVARRPRSALGFGCGEPCGDDDSRTTTAADGSYRLPLPNSYVEGTETDTDWFVTATAPGGTTTPSLAASSTFEFEVNIREQAAAPLPVWTRSPVVAVEGWTVVIDATGAVPAGLGEPTVGLRGGEGALVERATAATFDARLLEAPADDPRPIVARATARSDQRVGHANGRTIYHQEARSAGAVVPLAPVPESRGARCSATDATGAPADVTFGGRCLLTDGSFATSPNDLLPDHDEGDPAPPPVVDALIELSQPVDLSLVTLRGGSASIEVSPDGVAWTALPTTTRGRPSDGVTTDRVVLATGPGTPVRFARLHALGDDGLFTTEVSLWGPAPTAASAPGAGRGGPDGEGTGATGAEGSGDRLGTALRWVALGLVVAVWSGLGVVLVPGSTDRRRLRSTGLRSAGRAGRALGLRVACAVAAWPHLVDVLHRVRRHAPVPTPRQLVGANGPGRLHRYPGGSGAPVLIVHSVISSSSVLDLSPATSLVRGLLAADRDVWLLDWDFRHSPPELGLQHLAWEVDQAAAAVRERTGATTVPVVGYCLGATVALLREAAWPSGDPLALIAPVVSAAAGPDGRLGMGTVLGHPHLHPLLAVDGRGFVPAAVVRESFHWLRPKALRTVRTWSSAKADPDLATGYAAMAGWVWEHQDLPGGVLLDAVDLFRRGGLGAGWIVGGEEVDLSSVAGPVLVVCASHDHIVPPSQSTTLVDLAAGPVEVVEVDAGHVGMLVRLGSGDDVRLALVDWLARTAAPPTPEPPRRRARQRRAATTPKRPQGRAARSEKKRS